MNGIFALDLATNAGWAHSNGSSGVMQFKPKRGESSGMRYVKLGAFLTKMYKEHPFELVAYELPNHRGGAATEVLVGFMTHVQSWCVEKSLEDPPVVIEYTRRTSKEIKKHATGKGNASKLFMMMEAEKKWGFEPATDDQADALWLLDLVQKELGE